MEVEMKLIQGNCLSVVKTLPDQSVNCVITSPPYWGLRDYKVDGQFGLEPTPDLYVQHLVELFREIKRVLRNDGTVWLNLGDSYFSEMKGSGGPSNKQDSNAGSRYENIKFEKCGLKSKDLVGIPWKTAFALQQPYYTGVIKDEGDRKWVAALIDGEGCIGIRKQISSGNRNPDYNDSYIPYLTIKMSDREALDHIVKLTGYGNVREEPEKVGEDDRGIITRRTPFVWRLDGNKAVQIAIEAYPYLKIKNLQSACLYTLDLSNKEKKRGKGNSVPISEINYRDEIYNYIKSLNQRTTTDTPKWIKYPQPLFEPGWYLRSDCIWAKRNCMPESVKDRPTRSHEYIFLLTKSAKYYYDSEAIKEPAAESSIKRVEYGWNCDRPPTKNGSIHTEQMGSRFLRGFKTKDQLSDNQHHGNSVVENGYSRNKRDVWWVSTKPFKDAHFATFPEDLIEPCVLAGCPKGGTILDPFNGAGTTGVVALKHGRDYIGIELNPEYIAMSEKRIAETQAQMRLGI